MNLILKKIEEKFQNKNVFITNDNDIYYITRFKSSNLNLMFINGKWYAITDPRYLEAAKSFIKDMEIVDMSKKGWLSNIKLQNDFKEIFVDSDDVTLKQFEVYKAAFDKVSVKIDHFDYGYIRDAYLDEDIETMREASRINDELMLKVMEFVKPGLTERDVEAYILKLIIDSKAEGPSFEPIVASGENSSKPHWHASKRVIQENEMITIDMGVLYKGFCSDMTRTFSTGTELPEEAMKIWDVVNEAVEECTKMLKPGINCVDVHNKAVEIITSHGYGEYFTHGLGHGLGVEIHDQPVFNARSKQVLKSGQVMTIEPGIYLPGKFGCRIENAVLITETGYEVFNSAKITKFNK